MAFSPVILLTNALRTDSVAIQIFPGVNDTGGKGQWRCPFFPQLQFFPHSKGKAAAARQSNSSSTNSPSPQELSSISIYSILEDKRSEERKKYKAQSEDLDYAVRPPRCIQVGLCTAPTVSTSDIRMDPSICESARAYVRVCVVTAHGIDSSR